jgi:hypothetical protein
MIHACSFPTFLLVSVVLLLLTNDTAIRIINNRSAVVVEAFSTTSSSVLSHTPSTQRPQSASRSVLFAADEDAADAAAAGSDVSIPYDAAARLAFEALGDDTLAFEDYATTYKAEAIELVKSKGFFASSSSSSTGSAATTAVPETTSGGNPLLDGMEGSTNPIRSFDPMGLATIGSDETLRWLRAAEIKHSRVAMLATTGYLVQASGFHFPGMLSNTGISFESLSAVKPFEAWALVPDGGKAQILFFAFIGELASESQGTHYMKGGKYPEVVYPKFDFSEVSEETMFIKRNRELNNGRLAMIGIISFIAANAIPGSVPALAGLDIF